MRVFPYLIYATLFGSACASSAAAPPVTAQAASESSPPPPATKGDSDTPAAGEDEGWSGEKAAKASDAPSTATAVTEPTETNGKAPETRTMDVIRKLVMDNRKAARKCYEDARRDAKDLKGDVVIHFVLDPEGKVKSAELNQERSTLKSPQVTDCVIGVIRTIAFPKSSRGMETSTNYPFNFTP